MNPFFFPLSYPSPSPSLSGISKSGGQDENHKWIMELVFGKSRVFVFSGFQVSLSKNESENLA